MHVFMYFAAHTKPDQKYLSNVAPNQLSSEPASGNMTGRYTNEYQQEVNKKHVLQPSLHPNPPPAYPGTDHRSTTPLSMNGTFVSKEETV
jgi:hypothetical protein